jgi:hypothetical protein
MKIYKLINRRGLEQTTGERGYRAAIILPRFVERFGRATP